MGTRPHTVVESGSGRPGTSSFPGAGARGRVPASRDASQGDDAADALWNGRPPTVLLIEDDPGDALLVEELVADSDVPLRLSLAGTLAEAITALETQTPSASSSTSICRTPRAWRPWNGSSCTPRDRPWSS